MRRTARHAVLVVISLFVFGGCYHAVVNTGIDSGPRTIERKWAKGFVYGLVPPDAVEAEAECGSAGVARVETKHSFLNQLVSALTFGIFTPMEIIVTCGSGGDEDVDPDDQPEADASAAADGAAPPRDPPHTSKT